jgi:hypothetical protein
VQTESSTRHTKNGSYYPHDIYVLSLQQAKIETKRNEDNLMTKQIKKTDLKTS